MKNNEENTEPNAVLMLAADNLASILYAKTYSMDRADFIYWLVSKEGRSSIEKYYKAIYFIPTIISILRNKVLPIISIILSYFAGIWIAIGFFLITFAIANRIIKKLKRRYILNQLPEKNNVIEIEFPNERDG